MIFLLKGNTLVTFIKILCLILIYPLINRDCLLPVSLFESLLSKVSWKRNLHLVEIILPYAFNDSVRWFRRSQAVCMLVSFYQNTRLLEQFKDDNQLDIIEEKLSEYIIKVIINFMYNNIFVYI